MPLITTSVPDLLGGVSQSPPTHRLPNQCDLQENALSSVADGLTKRPPTEWVSELTSAAGSVNGTAIHTINRDVNERYVTSIAVDAAGLGTIRVHGIDGTSYDVVDNSNSYLDIGAGEDPAEKFDFVTISDVTYVLNKTKKTAYTAGVTAPHSRDGVGSQYLTTDPWGADDTSAEAVLWIKESSFSTRYKVHVDNNLAADYTTPDGVNSDHSVASAVLRVVQDDIPTLITALDTQSLWLTGYVSTVNSGGLDPVGGDKISRKYTFSADASTGTPAYTGKSVDNKDIRGTLYVDALKAKVKPTMFEHLGKDVSGTLITAVTQLVHGDTYNVLARSPRYNQQDLNGQWTSVAAYGEVNDVTNYTVDLADDDEVGGSGTWAGSLNSVDPFPIKEGDQIEWHNPTGGAATGYWVGGGATVKVGIYGVTTKGGILTELRKAIMSENGHNGIFSALIEDTDTVQAGNDAANEVAAPTTTSDQLTVTQTKSGVPGNTAIISAILQTSISYPDTFTDGSFPDNVGDEPEDLKTGTTDVAEAIAAQLTTNLAAADYDIEQSGSVIYLYKKPVATVEQDINVSIEDADGGDSITLIKRSVQLFNDLPPVAPDKFVVRIEGSLDTEVDNYYVRFDTNGSEDASSSLGGGSYTECAQPGILIELDPATMPHILIRQDTVDPADKRFYFKKADGVTGTTHGLAATPDYSNLTWHDRIVGDAVTNSDPSFIGYRLNSINFFKGRLALLSDTNVILSESGVYWNFFNVLSTSVLDSDVIDVAPSGERVSVLRSMVGYADRLILMSDQTQFALVGSPLVTPKTVSITPVSDFEMVRTCEPIRSATSLFFAFKRGDYTGVREMFVTNTLDMAFNSIDLTETIPAYISGEAKMIAASTHEDIVCVSTGDNKLYIYNYDHQGQQRTKSAWSVFTFSCDEILSISFIDSVLYMVVRRGSSIFIEKMNLTSGLKDSNADYVVTLDRRYEILASDTVRVVYNATTDQSTITIPYGTEAGVETVVTDQKGYIYSPQQHDVGTSVIIVEGDVTAVDLWIGERYMMKYKFSPPTMKRRNQAGQTMEHVTGRHQLRYGTILYRDSSHFTVNITPDYGTTSVYTFTGKDLGSNTAILGSNAKSSGEFRFPIFSKSDRVSVEIQNNSPLPSKFVSAEFEALYVSRRQGRY